MGKQRYDEELTELRKKEPELQGKLREYKDLLSKAEQMTRA